MWGSLEGGLGSPQGGLGKSSDLRSDGAGVSAGRPSPWPPAQPPWHLTCNLGPRTLIWQGPGWLRINAHSIGSRAWNIQNTWEMVRVFTVAAVNTKIKNSGREAV